MRLLYTSTLSLLIPAGLSVYYGLYFHFVLISLAMISSILFHHHNEEKYYELDNYSSLAVIISNLYLIFLANFNFPQTHIAIAFVFIAFHYYFKAKKEDYEFNHLMWHFSCTVITIFCVLAYGTV